MFDIATDIFRALITGAIFFYLRAMRGKESPRLRKAWIFLVIGFGLLFLGGLLNVAEQAIDEVQHGPLVTPHQLLKCSLITRAGLLYERCL